MGAEHRLIVRTHDGEYLTEIETWESFQYGKFINNVGWWMVVLPGDTPNDLADVDRIVEFWRKPEGGDEQHQMDGFNRYWDWFETGPNDERFRMGGEDQMGLLDRRIIAHKSTTDEASKTDEADDMQKAIVRENMGPLAPVTEANRPREFPPAHFEVMGDIADAPEITRSFAWRNVLDVLQEISETSGNLGTPLYFSIDHVGPAEFAFRTYTNVLGIDRTVSGGIAPIIFSKEAGNIRNPFMREDWREEHNYVWGAGQGQGTARTVDPEKDLQRIARSIWAKREIFQDAREESTVQGVANKAFERLQNERPRLTFRAELLDTPQSRYGIDWGFGDKVTIRFRQREFEGIVDNVSVSVDSSGKETLTSSLEIDLATG
jgi:hypothetical protein